MRARFGIIVLLLAGICRFSSAQNSQYKFSHLDITNGLSDNHINCVFKDKQGYMWFGTTSGGLSRYDGYNFRIFRHDSKDTSSLAENYVLNIDEGPEGMLWVFTKSGLSVYNPATEKFFNNTPAILTRYKILAGEISEIKKDKDGNFWFLARNQGLYFYDPAKHFTEFYCGSPGSRVQLHSNFITDMAPDRHDNMWLIYDDGTVDLLNGATGQLESRYEAVAEANQRKQRAYKMLVDDQQTLWIYSSSTPLGVYCYNVEKNICTFYNKDTAGGKLTSNIINTIVQADGNKMWFGTDHGGIDVFDRETHQVTYLETRPDDPSSLSGDCVNLYKDDANIIWVGTFKQGVNYYHSSIIQFPLMRHFVTDKNSLPYDDVNSFAEDARHNLWIGTNGGGLLYYDRTKNTYKQYRHDPNNPNSLSNDVIIHLFIDHEQQLWIGTYFGGMDRFDGNIFTHYRHSDNVPGSISDDRVYTIIEDAQKNLWAGTFAGGLNIYDRANHTFKHPKYPMSSEYTSIIYQDRQGNMWIGRDKGIDVILKKTNSVKHYSYISGNPNSLADNDVNAIVQDSRGLMWIGTKDGLTIIDGQSGKFIDVEKNIGLPANNVSNIVEDNSGVMWLSTTNGLASIRLSGAAGHYTYRINKYNEFDGLQGREFNVYACFKTSEGELAFGGPNGFNVFNPQQVSVFKPRQNLLFTDFQLFNKTVAAGDTLDGRVILTKAISQTKAVTLKHQENVFAIEFSACNYFNPGKVDYQYMLQGFDKNWITTSGNNRKVTYTNLDAGDYTFIVRAKSMDNPQSASMIKLKITVLPPFWATGLAYFIYFVVIAGVLLFIRNRGILKLKKQFEATQARLEAERKIAGEREDARRQHRLDLMKIKFFTNIGHEFRTPLTLILLPLENLIKISAKPEERQQLQTIKRNGRRLLNLVNQLLDFRKMEYNELKLSVTNGDIIQFARDVFSSFHDIASQKQIQYHFESEIYSLVTSFDHDKIERVFFNLLSNAFKFTPPGGHVNVILSLTSPERHINGKKSLEIKVVDTGIGVSKENQERIFERFFQDDLPENLLNQGSGIGLSITREFVVMHKGVIEIESETDCGTCFTIRLPISEQPDHLAVDEPLLELLPKHAARNMDELPGSSKKPVVLLIEDNDDLRLYLKDNLQADFHIIEAADGNDGWQKALAHHPRLIVSDIHMPGRNGVDLCRKIKADSRTSHIPVILLTALNGEADQMAGLESGASDYVVKPFNFEILSSRIRNLLKMQQVLKDTYQKQVEIQAQDTAVVSEYDKFLKSALDYIEQNMANPNLSVESLSSHLNVSRGSLYKKLLALTGKTPVDCIRTIRLKRATHLLAKSHRPIANIAYEVGFNNPAYFAKVFREEYGMLPSEYINEARGKEQDGVLV